MKSCRKIVSVSYVTPENGFNSHVVSEGKVVSVSSLLGSSARVEVDTFLSVIERSLAQDFSGYYDKFDKEMGIEYNTISKSNVSFDDSSSVVYSGSEVQSTCEGNTFCVRQLSLGNIRSFEVGLQDAEFSDLVGRDMTQVSLAVEPTTWVYLEMLVNRVLGWNFVSVDIQTTSLKFNYTEDDDMNDMAKSVYLLLSEIICFGCTGQPLVVLISEFPHQPIVRDNLVDALKHIKYDCQVFVP